MIANRAAFLVGWPEFTSAPEPLVTEALIRAAAQLDPAVCDPYTDELHGLLTAHMLALAPGGQNARLSAKDARTTYGEQFEKLAQQAACALRVF